MDLPNLTTNPFFSGGLVLMVIGGAIAYLRGLPAKIYDFFERFFILKIDIQDEDESYDWMRVWLAERLVKTLSISVVTKRQKTHMDPDYEDEVRDNRPQIYFVPAVGTYFFFYKGRFVMLNRDRRENSGGAGTPLLGENKALLRPKESFTVRIISRDKNLAKQLIEECRDKAVPEDGKLEVRTANSWSWTLTARTHPRRLDSVILDGDLAEQIMNDLRDFLSSEDWYLKVGVPWRRGYLLHGPPGGGKTSLVKALASEWQRDIYHMVLSDSDINDSRINTLLSRVPDNNFILLEDVDCAFIKRTKKEGRENGLSFSGLLNALDGVASQEGRIIFMTTNHVERLDSALIRPGRADRHFEIGNASQDQARRMFLRFFPDHAGLAGDFGRKVPAKRYCMAAIQNYLMLHRYNPPVSLEALDDLEKLQGVKAAA